MLGRVYAYVATVGANVQTGTLVTDSNNPCQPHTLTEAMPTMIHIID